MFGYDYDDYDDYDDDRWEQDEDRFEREDDAEFERHEELMELLGSDDDDHETIHEHFHHWEDSGGDDDDVPSNPYTDGGDDDFDFDVAEGEFGGHPNRFVFNGYLGGDEMDQEDYGEEEFAADDTGVDVDLADEANEATIDSFEAHEDANYGDDPRGESTDQDVEGGFNQF